MNHVSRSGGRAKMEGPVGSDAVLDMLEINKTSTNNLDHTVCAQHVALNHCFRSHLDGPLLQVATEPCELKYFLRTIG